MADPDAVPAVDDAEPDDDEQQREAIRQDNAKLLTEFMEWLRAGGIGPTTVRKHWGNLEFYLNHFLLYSDIWTAADGVSMVGEFLGWWFIRKAMWSSERSIKSNATSLTKFYTFMVEKGMVTPEELAALKQQIKAEMSEWLEELERFDNPDLDLDEL